MVASGTRINATFAIGGLVVEKYGGQAAEKCATDGNAEKRTADGNAGKRAVTAKAREVASAGYSAVVPSAWAS